MLWADEIPRVSLAQLRAGVKPRFWVKQEFVIITLDGVSSEIKLARQEGKGCVRGSRRWIICQHKGCLSNVLGYVRGFGWACRRCLGWRTRSRRTKVRPRLGEVDAFS